MIDLKTIECEPLTSVEDGGPFHRISYVKDGERFEEDVYGCSDTYSVICSHLGETVAEAWVAANKRTVIVNLPVVVPPYVDDDEVCRVLNMFVDAGRVDASDTLDNPDLDHSDAKTAMSLAVGQPAVVAVIQPTYYYLQRLDPKWRFLQVVCRFSHSYSRVKLEPDAIHGYKQTFDAIAVERNVSASDLWQKLNAGGTISTYGEKYNLSR